MRSGAEFFFVVHDAVIYIFSFTADLIVISFNKINEMRLLSASFLHSAFYLLVSCMKVKHESKNLTVRSCKGLSRVRI